MAGNILNRYVWLVDTINHAGKITLAEINQKWKQTDWSGGNDLPRRTFHNYRNKIEDLFDINIGCDGYNYIAPTSDFIRELLSSADDIEVLSPESLRDEMIQKIENIRNRYK